ncbi:MAG: hypothetical protein RL653_483 [Pseudomonadota bacterium]
MTLELDVEREADLRRCGALKDYWYVACLSAELGRERPIGRTLFGVKVALYRNAEGQAVAVRDRCLHRGAALSEGVVWEGKLCCPYHGWTYDDAGRCVQVPSLGPSQEAPHAFEADPKQPPLHVTPATVGCLETYPTREQDGLIYVFMGGEGRQPRKEPFPVPYWGAEGWTVYFMVTRFPNGVTNLVENFMDVPHTVFVHKGWFRDKVQKRVPATVERTDGSVLVTYEQKDDRLTGAGLLLNPFGEDMVHTDKYYVPNTTRVDYAWGKSGFVITSQCTPVGAMESQVYTAISYRLPVDLPGALVGRALKRVMHWYTTQVITQDVEIMGTQRRGLEGGDVQFRSTEADLLHADIEAYRAWLLAGQDGDGPPPARRTIEFWL